MHLAFMPNLGPTELLIILAIILLLFGATRLPKLGKSLGQSVRGFKQGLNEAHGNDDEADPARLEKGEEKPKDA